MRPYVRRISTGFTRSSPEFLDPYEPLFATQVNDFFRHSQDPSLRSPILERSNVGMGALCLNGSLSFSANSQLYTRLRDLEVNPFKRYVLLCSRVPTGWDYQQLFSLALSSTLDLPEGPECREQALSAWQDVAHLVFAYHKPLISFLGSENLSLPLLASIPTAYEHSSFTSTATRDGFCLRAGESFLLGNLANASRVLPGLGEYLGLTGQTLKASDLVHAGLAQQWASPEAIEFLEDTSSNYLEVPESQVSELLSEHFLSLPETEWSLAHEYPQIARIFTHSSVTQINKDLQTLENQPRFKRFAQRTLQALNEKPALSQEVVLHQIQLARSYTLMHEREFAHNHQLQASDLQKTKFNNPQLYRREVLEPAFWQTLQMEKQCALRFFECDHAWQGAAAQMTGQAHEFPPTTICPSSFFPTFAPTNPPPRSEIPLSSNVLLRQFHPDYNPDSQLDYCPFQKAEERDRFSVDKFNQKMDRILKELQV